MQTNTDKYPEEIPCRKGLEDMVRLLADELRASRAEMRRQRLRSRATVVALVFLLAIGGWLVLPAFSAAQSHKLPAAPSAPLSRDEQAVRRAELIAALPAGKQRELENFEREVDWLNSYMQTWDEGKAGAVVAIMLFRMAQSMDTMPSMEQQMRTMSGQMGALPAIVAELNQINAKMHVITGTMDSTMGRAGRMMPWMPFSP